MDTPSINDLNICVATENGSGSASSNNILFKAIFKMGIPCSSKNMYRTHTMSSFRSLAIHVEISFTCLSVNAPCSDGIKGCLIGK